MIENNSEEWEESPQFEEGWWWFYGDDSFGSMGGNFTGSIPPVVEMHLVRIRNISNGMMAVTSGRFMRLEKFNPKTRSEGYLGVWKRAQLPEPPDLSLTELGNAI